MQSTPPEPTLRQLELVSAMRDVFKEYYGQDWKEILAGVTLGVRLTLTYPEYAKALYGILFNEEQAAYYTTDPDRVDFAELMTTLIPVEAIS